MTGIYSLALRGMEIKQGLSLQSFYQEAAVLAYIKNQQNSYKTDSTFYRLSFLDWMYEEEVGNVKY